MAVFKPDLSWTTLQDKQLKALESLNEVVIEDLGIQKEIRDYLTKGTLHSEMLKTSDYIGILFDRALKNHLSAPYNTGNLETPLAPEIDFRSLESHMDSMSDNIVSSIEDNTDTESDTTQSLIDVLEGIRDDTRDIRESTPPIHIYDDLLAELKSLGYGMKDRLMESVDTMTSSYNDTLKFLGVNGEDARKFRSDVISEVSSLNNEVSKFGVGGKFSPSRILDTMLAISNQTSLSNQETLKQLVRPLTLAQETLDVRLTDLADLGKKFYTSYKFNEGSLENLINQVRSVTANRDVNQQGIIDALNELSPIISATSKGDSAYRDSTNEGITNLLTYLEHNGLNTSQYKEDLKILLGEMSDEKKNLIPKYGRYFDEIDKDLHSGDALKVFKVGQKMVDAINSHGSLLVAERRGIDSDQWYRAQNFQRMKSDGSIQSPEEFLATTSKDTAIDIVQDKFVSVEEQMINKMDDIAQYLSSIQETLGIGFKDVSLILSTAGNLYAALGGVGAMRGGGLAGILGGGGTLGRGGIAGLLSKAGPAVGIGAVLFGVAGVVEGIKKSYDQVNQMEIDNYKNTVSSIGELKEGKEVAPQKVVGVKDGSISTELQMGQIDKGKYKGDKEKVIDEALKAQLTEIANRYEKDRKWYHYLFGLGSEGNDWYDILPIGAPIEGHERRTAENQAVENAEFSKSLIRFYDSLSKDDQILYNAYRNKGLLVEGNTDQMKFFMKNFDKFRSLSEKELAAEVSDSGLSRPLPRKELLGYDKGTNYVPYDQVAYIHKGEAITPAEYNPANNMNELERLRSEKEENSSPEEFAAMISVLSDIREFMKYWKEDSDIKRNTIKYKNQPYMSSFERFQTLANR